MRKELARAAHTALDLVQNQQNTMFIAQSANVFERLVGKRANAALALHRFNQDRRSRFGNRRR